MIEFLQLLRKFFFRLSWEAYLAFFIHEILFGFCWLLVYEEIMHLLDPIRYLGVERIGQFLVYVALHELPPIFILFLDLLSAPLCEILAEGDHELGYFLFHCC